MGRLIEAELFFDFRDEGRVQALRAAVHVVAAAAAHAYGVAAVAAQSPAAHIHALDLGQHALDRPARGHLHDDKIEGDNPQ